MDPCGTPKKKTIQSIQQKRYPIISKLDTEQYCSTVGLMFEL